MSRRGMVQGLLTSGAGALLTGALACEPSPAATPLSAARRPFSSFGNDPGALQRAFDWAHRTGGALVLDREAIVDRTVFMGNLHLIDGGGRILIRGDAAYHPPEHTGRYGWAAISMRSAPENRLYGEPIDTRYLVRIERGCRIDFVRSDPKAPKYPMRFTGLAEGSYLYPTFTASCPIDGECNGPDWYFFNRCRVGGSYSLEFTGGGLPPGGFWLRDIDETGLGPSYYSDFQLDNPVFSKIGGDGEAATIFTTTVAPGHLRARGSVTVARSTSLGFSILNRSKAPPQDFDVSLDTVRVRSTVRDDQPVMKIIDDHARVRVIDATVTGEARGTYNSAVLQCINEPGSGSRPRIGQARLASEGAGSGGYAGVVALRGECTIDQPSISGVRKAAAKS